MAGRMRSAALFYATAIVAVLIASSAAAAAAAADNSRVDGLWLRKQLSQWGDQTSNFHWGCDLKESVLVELVIGFQAALAGVEGTDYTATLLCRNLGSGPSFDASELVTSDGTGSLTMYFTVDLFTPTAVLPTWTVGDRYACTASLVRPDGTVSAPSGPPLFLRVIRGYDCGPGTFGNKFACRAVEAEGHPYAGPPIENTGTECGPDTECDVLAME